MRVAYIAVPDGEQAGDGVFATEKNGHLSLVDLKSNTTRSLVAFSDVQDVSLHALHLHDHRSYVSSKLGVRCPFRPGNCRPT